MDFNQPNIVLPDVLLRVISVLEDGKGPVSWTLTRSWKGQLSLNITHPPAKSENAKPSELLTLQDSDKAAPVKKVGPLKRKKSPSQIKRDRERWNQWHQKRKSGSRVVQEPSEPVVNDQLDSSRKALDIQCSSKQEDTTQSQDKSEHLEQPVYGAEGVLSCSEVDSDDDHDDDVIELPDFCANCNCKPFGVILKRCSRCQLSQYCSVECQKENWKEHKFACSVISSQRSSKVNCK